MVHRLNHNHKNKIQELQKEFPLLIKAVMFMAIAEPLMTFPQVYEIWINHQTAGVSIMTWAFMFLASMTWLTYSIKIKNIPMMTSSSIWAITEAMIVIGIFVF